MSRIADTGYFILDLLTRGLLVFAVVTPILLLGYLFFGTIFLLLF